MWRFALAILGASSLALPSCGGSSSPTASTPVTADFGSAGPNVQPIVVNAGPANNYANGAFTSVIVCVPGTASCQTIDGVLVDTGSSGLRLLASVLKLALPPVQNASGSQILECNQFLDSYQWGPLVQADIKLAGEVAPGVPLQSIGGAALPSVPADCTSAGLPAQDTVESLGANGVLGIGLWRQDCGPACAVAGPSNPGFYYTCSASGCQATAVPLERQAQNPVWLFASDNNGLALQLPAVPQLGAVSVNGSLVFGIGTRSNNMLGSAAVYTVDGQGYFTTTFRGVPYSASFIDSGSNGLFFLDAATTAIPTCRDSPDFYCPTAPLSLTATNRGQNGTSATVSFNLVNADTLFNSPNNAWANLGGPNSGGFDWGLPFFFGRVMFTGIELQPTPSGPGPYFAY